MSSIFSEPVMKKTAWLICCQLLLAVFAVGQNNWQWLNPRPSGFTCLKVAFTDSSTGYILNGNGDLIKTTDQGVSWNIIENFPLAAAMDIKYSTGVIVTTSGSIFVSSDNGITWDRVKADTVDRFVFVNIVSRDSFFVSTAYGDIYATGDRGATWSSTRKCPGPIECITFLNSMTGYAGSNSNYGLLRTDDGGSTWRVISQVNYSPSDITAINFTSRDTGYAFRNYSSVLVTYDGGNTWTASQVSVINPASVIYFATPSIGFLGGPGGTLYRTLDAGVNWIYAGPPNNAKNEHDINSFAFVSPATGFAVGFLGQIWKTTDTGSTWTSYSPTYTPIESAYFPSPSVGYAANGNYLLKTVDSGKTWNTMSLTTGTYYGSNSSFQFVHFESPDTGYVISDQSVQVHRTNDGGQTWTTVVPTGYGYQQATSISYSGNKTALLCMNTNSGLAETNDGGNTWPQVWPPNPYSGPPNYLTTVFYVNPTTAYGAYLGQLYKTTNAFQSWTPVFNNSLNYFITGIWFFDAQHGFISDEEAEIFETTDGGSSWHLVRGLTAADNGGFSSTLKFFNPKIGYMTTGSNFAFGFYGHVYKTVDAGQTWQLSYPIGGASIQFTADSNIILAGFGGSILRSPVGGWQTDSLSVVFDNACGTLVSASVGVALGRVDSIRVEITSAGGKKTIVDANPGQVADGRVSIATKVNGLTPDTLYSLRLSFLYNGSVAYSDTVEFIAAGIPTPYAYDSLGTLISTAGNGNQWFLNGQPITGAVGQRYMPSKSGTYTVDVTENNCTTRMSQPLIFQTAALGVMVYPDPARDFLYIRNTQGRMLRLEVIDLMGRTLMTEKYVGWPIDVSRLAAGEYVLHVTDLTNGQTGNLFFLKF